MFIGKSCQVNTAPRIGLRDHWWALQRLAWILRPLTRPLKITDLWRRCSMLLSATQSTTNTIVLYQRPKRKVRSFTRDLESEENTIVVECFNRPPQYRVQHEPAGATLYIEHTAIFMTLHLLLDLCLARRRVVLHFATFGH